jgi:hypothetical protein
MRRRPRRHHLFQHDPAGLGCRQHRRPRFLLSDLLHLDGEDLAARQLIERKTRLAALLAPAGAPLQYSDHQIGHGPAFHARACAMKLEEKLRCSLPPVFITCI